MKRLCTFLLTFSLPAALGIYSCRNPECSAELVVAQSICRQLNELDEMIGQELIPAVRDKNAENKGLQILFAKVRLAYKQSEWAVAYFTPGSERLINGAPVPEVEPSGQVLQAGGFQVIENELFPVFQARSRTDQIGQWHKLQAAIRQSRLYFEHVPLLNWQIWEASRLEIFRVETLGISGFDAPLSENSIVEASSALHGVNQMLSTYDPAYSKSLTSLFNDCNRYLVTHPQFDSFDRAEFITRYVNPLSEAVFAEQRANHIKPLHYGRLLRQNAGSLFDRGAFDPNAFAEPGNRRSAENIAFGKQLFNEPLLSGNGSRSCASCHQPDKAFSDGLVVNTNILTHKPLLRKTPTLINAALQPAQFADMRVITLEQQVDNVLTNPAEMHSSLAQAAARLSKAKGIRITPNQIAVGLADYVRSLSLLNSRFDAYMQGNSAALSTQEVSGFNLFMGKARCGSCHYLPLFNGALPPYYEKMDAEVLGVPGKDRKLDRDPGQFGVIAAAPLGHAFKTPTVRNTAYLSHFMHNGIFSSLDEVLDFYNKGGGAGMGLLVPNQTLSATPLRLSQRECKSVIAFIKSLNSSLPGEQHAIIN
jgi:cytochrome c peroxidase